MGKLKENQEGFSAVEVVLVVVIVALVGVVGWLVYKNHHKTTTISTTTTSTTKPATSKTTATTTPTQPVNPYAGWQTFTSADKVYTVNYPSNWVGDSCAASNNCHTDTFSFDNDFSPSANSSWQVVTVQHTSSSSSPQAWLDQYEQLSGKDNCLYSSNSNAVNSYQAYFTEVYKPLNLSNPSCPSSPPVGAYSYGSEGGVGYMDYYVVVDNSQVVMFSMPVQNGSNGTRNTAPLASTFNEIVKSIKFN